MRSVLGLTVRTRIGRRLAAWSHSAGIRERLAQRARIVLLAAGTASGLLPKSPDARLA